MCAYLLWCPRTWLKRSLRLNLKSTATWSASLWSRTKSPRNAKDSPIFDIKSKFRIICFFIAISNVFLANVRFSHAAEAFEQCNAKYKAVFAEPKSTSRAGSTSERSERSDGRSSHGRHHEDTFSAGSSRFDLHTSFSLPVTATNPPSQNQATLNVVCSSSVSYHFLF